MRIAVVAPVAMGVQPGVGESIEQLVWMLTEELVRRGHRVTLFATGDSHTSAQLSSVYPRGYEDEPDLWDWYFHETMHAGAAFEQAGDFDVVHCHDYHFALPFTRLTATPVVHTHHVEVNPDVREAYGHYPEVHLVVASEFQRSALAGLPNVTVVPHGIDTHAFPFGAQAGDYLLFLGRMIADKGPVHAVEAARALDMPLLLAGPGGDHYDADVAPLVDGERVQYLGRISPARRDELLAGAAALLFPAVYPEPFGLVMIEAMACGTPVAATAIGAAPELIEDGVTGACADSPAALPEAVTRALALDRALIRERAQKRFDYRRMVDGYEALYATVATAHPRAAR
jgi:glycosyltransferase involved in cell wall biosynthesis